MTSYFYSATNVNFIWLWLFTLKKKTKYIAIHSQPCMQLNYQSNIFDRQLACGTTVMCESHVLATPSV
jgi:hypothetical protein